MFNIKKLFVSLKDILNRVWFPLWGTWLLSVQAIRAHYKHLLKSPDLKAISN